MKKFAQVIGATLIVNGLEIILCTIMSCIACRCFYVAWKPSYGMGIWAIVFAANSVWRSNIMLEA